MSKHDHHKKAITARLGMKIKKGMQVKPLTKRDLERQATLQGGRSIVGGGEIGEFAD